MIIKSDKNNVVFDLYGTLVDIHTDEDNKNFWKKFAKLLRKNGIHFYHGRLKAEYIRLCGVYEKKLQGLNPGKQIEINISDVFFDLCHQKNRKITREQSDTLGRKFREYSTAYIRVYDDTFEMFERLRKEGKKIWLLSNAQALFTMPELEKLGLIPCFDGIAISSDAGFKKPDEAFAGYLFGKYNLNASDCVMVGNEYGSDVMVAKNSGMKYIYVESNLTSREEIGKHEDEVSFRLS